MDEIAEHKNHVTSQLMEMDQRLVALGNTVESLFADSVVALVEPGVQSAKELREEDYRAHEQWIELDGLCREVLVHGALEPEQIRFLTATIKIAADLKRMADESLRLGQSLLASGAYTGLRAGQPDGLPQMVGLTQGMLSDVIEAFINRDLAEAAGLHLAFREVSSLEERCASSLARQLRDLTTLPEWALTLMGVVQRLERIAGETLNIANEVDHLYRGLKGS